MRVHPNEFTSVQLAENAPDDASVGHGLSNHPDDADAWNELPNPPAASAPGSRPAGSFRRASISGTISATISAAITFGAGLEAGGLETQPSKQLSPRTRKKRKSLHALRQHQAKLPSAQQREACEFRSFPAPRHTLCISSVFAACVSLQLAVGAPYAAVLRAGGSAALHGLIGGVLAVFIIGAVFLVTCPTRVAGAFHPRYLLSVPIPIGIGIAVGFIRSDGAMLSLLSIALIATALGYVGCIVCLNFPFYLSTEHKQLDRSLGPPLMLIGFMFFLWIAMYAEVNHRSSSPFVGVLLPLGSWVTRVAALFLLSRSCHFKYFMPKLEWLDAQLEDAPPVLFGDVEAQYGYFVVFFALLIGGASYVSMLVEVVQNPESTAWIMGLALSFVVELMDRTSVTQRVQLRAAALFKLETATRLVRITALKTVFYNAQLCTEFAAPIMALCIGVLRAVTFSDARAILWLDVNPTVVIVIGSHFASEVLLEAVIWLAAHKKLANFVFVDMAPQHPLGNLGLRAFHFQGYAFLGSFGCACLYIAFLLFLGPKFVTGVDRDYTTQNSWLLAASSSLNVTNVTNHSQPGI